MNMTNQNAYIYNTHNQSDYDAFDRAVQISGKREELKDGYTAFVQCSTADSTVDNFEFASRDTNATHADNTASQDLNAERIVPSMLVLGKVGSSIRSLISGKVTDLNIHFYELVKVGDDLQIEVKRSDCPAIESLTRVYFFARVGDKVVAEGNANIDTDKLDTETVNPFFAAGLFSAVVCTKLSGPSARFREFSIKFDGEFVPGMPLRTLGSLQYVESGTGRQHIDLFCLSSIGIYAHAEATVARPI